MKIPLLILICFGLLYYIVGLNIMQGLVIGLFVSGVYLTGRIEGYEKISRSNQ
jgi:hypothetical protein